MRSPELTSVIVNPAAAGGRVGRELDAIRAKIRAALGDVEFRTTRSPGDAAAQAEEAVRAGRRVLLSLGGDGTHSEVTNGIMRAGLPPGEIVLGILPGGTGGDFRRLLREATDLDAAIRLAASAEDVPIDVGSLRFVGWNGEQLERYFLNIASFGMGGLVDRHVNAARKWMSGKATYFFAALRALVEYRPATVRITVDGAVVGEFRISNVSVANGRFFGGGMHISPNSRLADGKFHVIVQIDDSILEAIRMTRTLYRGTHLSLRSVREFVGSEVRAEPLTARRAYLDIDGEPLGVVPADFRVHPGAVRLIGPRADVL